MGVVRHLESVHNVHTECCALCPGAIDWHNCGTILGVREFGWDWFMYMLPTLYNNVHN